MKPKQRLGIAASFAVHQEERVEAKAKMVKCCRRLGCVGCLVKRKGLKPKQRLGIAAESFAVHQEEELKGKQRW